MKNLFRLSAVILVFAIIGLTSCDKEDSQPKQKEPAKTQVNFASVKESGTRSESVNTNRPEDVHVSAASMQIDATCAAAGATPLSKIWNFVDDGSGEDGMLMDTYLGWNAFDMTTTPYFPDFGDGFEAGTTDDLDAKVAELRALRPWLIFTAKTEQTIVAGENTVLFDATTQNGRLFMTFELDDAEGAPFLNEYDAYIAFMIEDDNSDAWTSSHVLDLNNVNPAGWFYFSNSSAVDQHLIRAEIWLHEKAARVQDEINHPEMQPWFQGLVKTWKLNEIAEYANKIRIEGGKDKYVHVLISKESVKVTINGTFNFIFNVEQSDDEIIL